MINYLASATRPNILFSVHQAKTFCSDPKKSYEEAVKHIGRYSKKILDKDMIFKFDQGVLIEICTSTDFAGT